MTGGVRLVLPSERHVERVPFAPAETRDRLRARLLDVLAPELALASSEHTRLALAEALPRIAADDPSLAPLLAAGEETWTRAVDAIDRALGVLRASCVAAPSLLAVERRDGVVGRRARVLRLAMTALDERLTRHGLVDSRVGGEALARAIAASDPELVRLRVGSARVVARYLVAWDPVDVAWWRALDVALAKSGGGATIELPSFERPLDAGRAVSPVDAVIEALTRALDEPPALATIESPLGDLSMSGAPPDAARARVSIRRASDAHAQARAVAAAVQSALADGTAVDAIAIGLPALDEATLAPLRLALAEAEVVARDPRGVTLTAAPMVATATRVLGAASRGLPRRELAAMLRSRYVDAAAIAALSGASPGVVQSLARVLDEEPTMAADSPLASLEATAGQGCASSDEDDSDVDARRALARKLGELLLLSDESRTRAAHVATARHVWKALGIDLRVGRAVAASFASDAPRDRIARIEIEALARDAQSFVALDAALEQYAEAARAVGGNEAPIAGITFRHELAKALEGAAPPPGGARAGAVRIATLRELAGQPLALLIVPDANEDTLPRAATRDPLLGDALLAALRELGHTVASPATTSARELSCLLLATASAERVVFAYRERDDSGAALAQAPLLDWLARGGVPVSRWGASWIDARALSASEARLSAIARDPSRGAALAPDAARRAAIERARESVFERGAREAIQGVLPPSDERAQRLAEATGGGGRPMAVTALETFAGCAFAGFARHVLGARETVSVEDAPDARTVGSLKHGALAEAFRAARALLRARPRDRDAIAATAMAAVDRFLESEAAASPMRRLALERVRADVRAVLDWSVADEAWDFDSAEQSFGNGKESSWPPFVIDDGATRVTLQGSIDRVDLAHGRAAVRALDYKSSAQAAKDAGNALGDRTFQVAIYAKVAARAHGVSACDGAYVPARSGAIDEGFAPSKRHLERWALSMEDAGGAPAIERRALEVIDRVRSGDVAPDLEATLCRTCAYDGACRKPRFAMPDDEETSE